MTDQLGRGAALAVAGAAAFACMSAAVKIAGHELPPSVTVFFRNCVALVLLIPLVLMKSRQAGISFRTNRLGMHLIRVGTGLAGMYCFFYAISQIHLANAVLLNYSQPLFLPFIAWAWIGEKPPMRIFPAVALGFIGITGILKPGLGFVGIAGVAGVTAGLLAATAMASIRRMATTEPALRIVFYFSLLATLFSALPAAAFWQTPTPTEWLALIGAGGFAVAGQLCLTRAYTLAPAAHVGTLVYSTVVFATLIAWLLWDEAPDYISILGGILVIAAGSIVVFARRPRESST
ncbi:DMT family transporter [Salinisphaera orenii]|uniref:DMT family transporter n=1 Tax=Salinisphaera orenii TaxID=856731 RepID=UPI000DBE0BEB